MDEDGGVGLAAVWRKRKKGEGMKRPYSMRVYPAGSPHMKVLERLYFAPGRSLDVGDLGDVEKRHIHILASRQLVDVIDDAALGETEGGGESTCKKIVITTPGVAHFIASRYGLSFAYAVYLAYLYVESRDPLYAFTLAGGDAERARMMVEGKAEYPYGMLHSQKTDKKFEGANMFVLGTFVKERGCCNNGVVPEIARHELSRRGIVRCVPGGTLMIPHEKYKELQKYDADLRDIVAWAERVCDKEASERMSEATVLVGSLNNGGSAQTATS